VTRSPRRARALPALLLLVLAGLAGCDGGAATGPTPAPLLPKSVRLHSFTGTRTFAAGRGVSGIEARVELRNQFDDATMALGTFRFSLYRYQPHQTDPRGKRLDCWSVDLTDPQTNRKYWDSISRTYKVPLAWDKPIPVGTKFVLEVAFSAPEGPRLFDQITRVSGD